MPKKEEKEPEKSDISENSEKIEKIEEKVEKKVDEVEKKVEAKTGKRQNLIGELADPKVDEEFDYRAWAKSVDEKLDKLMGKLPEEKEEPVDDQAPPPKVPWYEKELF